MCQQPIRGVIVPVITPIDADENVDEPAFRRQLQRLIEAGVHALFVGGSAGEGPLLADAAWRRMAEIAFEEAGGKLPLLGGVMDTSARRAREKIRVLRGIGYPYFVLTPTYYITVKAESEHLRLFGEARDAAGDMEMIAYNIPQCTSSRLAVDTVCEMARRGWIRSCKESSGDIAYFRELARRGKDAGLSVFAGDEFTLVEELQAGAAGIVPVCANIFPDVYLRAFEAAARGDWTAVARAHEENLRVREPLVAGGACWLAGIKYAASVLGVGSGRTVSPLEPAGRRQQERIEQLLKERAREARPA